MAVKDLVAAMNDVPERIGKIASGLPYRDFVTVGLLVDKASVKRYLMGKRISVKEENGIASGLLDLCAGAGGKNGPHTDI